MNGQTFKLFILSGRLAVCRLAADAPVPGWVEIAPSKTPSTSAFCSVTRTADELSIVCQEDTVPDGVQCERGWRALRVAGTLDFSMVGVVASLAVPLAEAGVSIFVLSTFDTDYLLIKDENLDDATRALIAAGHSVTMDD